MLRLLFVDDDKPLLNSLRRSMSVLRPEWECFYFESGLEALGFLENESVDVVVTDIRMPELDGVEFLSRVKKRFPNPVRIILSGHMGEHENIQSVNVAHYFIAKPCPVEDLINTIDRLSSYRDIFTDKSLLSIVNSIDSLPVLPDVYFEVSNAVNDSNKSLDDIGNLISKDPGMATSILKTVNSPFFGICRDVHDVNQAVRMLGMETIRGLVLCEGVFRQFNSRISNNFSLNLLWEHSLRVSSMSRRIAEHEGLDSKERDLATLAGLLHDLGKLILLDQLPEKYSEVLTRVREGKMNTMKAEIDVFGISHAKLGAYLLGLWGCAESIVYSVAYHHQPSTSKHDDMTLLSILHAANSFDHELYRLKSDLYDRLSDNKFMEEAGVTEKLEGWSQICRDTLEAD